MIFPLSDGGCGWYEVLPKPGEVTPTHFGFDRAYRNNWWGICRYGCRPQIGRNSYLISEFVLLDALRIGQGASGRNSGFVIDQPHKREPFELSSDENKRLPAAFKPSCDSVFRAKNCRIPN
ncbi:hypothetical protein PEC18_00910 [Paucibacter sp. O1-1]|nr:hypothetical protein [Paucibacter sp. O1-1]MDA3824459.1 hypothetical protein [Paucibacter sp. O1-1]